jgi:hypothetical protein
MSEQRTIENIPAEEFEQIVNRFIEQAAAWDGALPAETFFETWDVLTDEETPLEVQAVIVGDELLLETPPESPLTARGSRIRLEDGRELVIRLRSVEPTLRV